MTRMQAKKQKNRNVPNLRFPGFEGEWSEKKLGEFIDVISGIPLPAEEILEDESYAPILRGINITEGVIRHSKEIDRYYPINDADKVKKYLLEEDDLVIGMDGSKVGKNAALISKNDVGAILIQRVARVKPIPNADIHYIFQRILSNEFRIYVDTVNTSSGIPHISLQQIKDFKTSFPPTLVEQRKISLLLCLLDKRIATQSKIIEELKSSIISMIKKLLSQRLRFHSKPLEALSAWHNKKIKDVLIIGNGKDYKHLNKGTIPVYGTGGIITFVDSFLHDGETVCIGRKGTIDAPIFLTGKIWTVDTLFYSHSFAGVVPKFVYYFFRSIRWKEYNEATGVPSLSKSTIEKIAIQLPSLEEQSRIVNFLSKFEEKIEIETALVKKYQSQKEYLLSQLFT